MIDEFIKGEIKSTIKNMGGANTGYTNTSINKADYDKTLIGFVSEKIVPENPKDGNDYKWRIQTNGVAYDIKPSACNITSVGQRVRLYVPNHSLKDKYAEVIDNADCIAINITKEKITFSYSDSTSEDITLTRDSQNRITSFTYFGKTVEVKRDGI